LSEFKGIFIPHLVKIGSREPSWAIGWLYQKVKNFDILDAWIWTLFSLSVRELGVLTLQRSKHFIVPSVGCATKIANLQNA